MHMSNQICLIAALALIAPFMGIMAQNGVTEGDVVYRRNVYVPGSGEADSIPMVVYDRITEPPEFYGGNYALEKFVLENVKYPAEAWNDTVYKKKDVLYYDCVIRKDGQIVFPRPQRMHPALADEIARVFALFPSCKPAKYGDEYVNVTYNIEFSLLDDYFNVPLSAMPSIKKAIAAAKEVKGKYSCGISRAEAENIASRILAVHDEGWNEISSTLTGARLLATLGRYDEAIAMLERGRRRYHRLGFDNNGRLDIILSSDIYYKPHTDLDAIVTLAAIYDMAGMKDKAREAYGEAIKLAESFIEQGIVPGENSQQRMNRHYDLMREKAYRVMSQKSAAIRLNGSDRRDIGGEWNLGEMNSKIEDRVAEGKISDARVTQINNQMHKMNFASRFNRKSSRDCVRLSKLCAMLIGLRDGTDDEKDYVATVSDRNVSGKKVAERISRWSKNTEFPVCSRNELLECLVFYAPLNETGVKDDAAKAESKNFYERLRRLSKAYPLAWMRK
mgnify:CR=1 FL=1